MDKILDLGCDNLSRKSIDCTINILISVLSLYASALRTIQMLIDVSLCPGKLQ